MVCRGPSDLLQDNCDNKNKEYTLILPSRPCRVAIPLRFSIILSSISCARLLRSIATGKAPIRSQGLTTLPHGLNSGAPLPLVPTACCSFHVAGTGRSPSISLVKLSFDIRESRFHLVVSKFRCEMVNSVPFESSQHDSIRVAKVTGTMLMH